MSQLSAKEQNKQNYVYTKQKHLPQYLTQLRPVLCVAVDHRVKKAPLAVSSLKNEPP